MSIEGSLALAGLALLTLGVVASAHRTSLSSTECTPAAGSGSEASPLLLAARVVVVATCVLFTGLF